VIVAAAVATLLVAQARCWFADAEALAEARSLLIHRLDNKFDHLARHEHIARTRFSWSITAHGSRHSMNQPLLACVTGAPHLQKKESEEEKALERPQKKPSGCLKR
jgi:hypothetical protein